MHNATLPLNTSDLRTRPANGLWKRFRVPGGYVVGRDADGDVVLRPLRTKRIGPIEQKLWGAEKSVIEETGGKVLKCPIEDVDWDTEKPLFNNGWRQGVISSAKNTGATSFLGLQGYVVVPPNTPSYSSGKGCAIFNGLQSNTLNQIIQPCLIKTSATGQWVAQPVVYRAAQPIYGDTNNVTSSDEYISFMYKSGNYWVCAFSGPNAPDALVVDSTQVTCGPFEAFVAIGVLETFALTSCSDLTGWFDYYDSEWGDQVGYSPDGSGNVIVQWNDTGDGCGNSCVISSYDNPGAAAQFRTYAV